MGISTGLVYNARTEDGGFDSKDLKCDNCKCQTTVMIDLDRKFTVCKSCLSEFIQKLDTATLNY